MQEELGGEEKEKTETQKQEGPKDPRDPEDRGNAEPEDGAAGGEDPRAQMPTWMVDLPPQLRDAFARRDFNAVPPEYREFVERYLLWLLEEERRQNAGR